ncbi:hypothetical protein BCR32DRAFT_64603 [Anaeromyces robustus]|uniref:Uncharacterized protein n=1 Tax=Anaeromyces robustus TaxID=1754192 RepID=A0A1Y1WVC4_9FUNG|nr:hypothetical protein BCR32DRAFT_64603 [Anaeromyces robustus]|eukprot:ORX77156.1 hypothetical protein BCR32DRAFT_64603 [Anaeromyces robustus]
MGEFSGARRNSNITLMQSKTFKKNYERCFSAEIISQSVDELRLTDNNESNNNDDNDDNDDDDENNNSYLNNN